MSDGIACPIYGMCIHVLHVSSGTRMVLPHLQYFFINWGNFEGDSNLGLRNEILSLQKSLVRIITGSKSTSHADPLFSKIGALKIDDLFKQSVRIFSFKAQRGLLPPGMSSLFDRVNEGHNYNTRGDPHTYNRTKPNVF